RAFTMTANADVNSVTTGSISNTATVTTGCVATAAHPCTTTVTNIVPPPPTAPECTPSKTATPTGSVPMGTVITYTVSVKNTGSAKGNCSIVDALTTDSKATTFDLVQAPV